MTEEVTKHGYIEHVTYEVGERFETEYYWTDPVRDRDLVYAPNTERVQRDPVTLLLRSRIQDLEADIWSLQNKLKNLQEKVDELNVENENYKRLERLKRTETNGLC